MVLPLYADIHIVSVYTVRVVRLELQTPGPTVFQAGVSFRIGFAGRQANGKVKQCHRPLSAYVILENVIRDL